MAKLPDCIWTEISVYVTSPATGIINKVSLGGKQEIDPEADYTSIVQHAVYILNEMTGGEDARPMTREEVRAYREGENG